MDPRIKKIAEHLGIQLDMNRTLRRWDGKSISCKNLFDSDIIHEIAHWMVAPQSRRDKIDFGIYKELSIDESNNEEALASLLGVSFEAGLGMDYIDTLLEHSLIEFSAPALGWYINAEYAISQLTRRRMMKNHYPVLLEDIGMLPLVYSGSVFAKPLSIDTINRQFGFGP